MDISRLRPVRISNHAREKVISDFFPELFSDDLSVGEKLSALEVPIHAGALCLYATTLVTKVFETDPLALEPYYDERKESLKRLIKATPKHANLTDDEVDKFAQNAIIADIRNSFAHGNFEISYDVHTKKMYFVLLPKRKDFVTPEPIVISKNALIKENKKVINEIGRRYMTFSEQMMQNEVDNNLDSALRKFMIPTQMMKITDYYIGNKPPAKQNVLFDEGLYYLIEYVLLVSKMTYDQNEYYEIFGSRSNVFEAISLIRNSIAHDWIEFKDNATNISYDDRGKTLFESVGESAAKLLIVDSQKNIIQEMRKKHKPESTQKLTSDFKEIFDFFFGGKYDFKDIIDTISEFQEGKQKE